MHKDRTCKCPLSTVLTSARTAFLTAMIVTITFVPLRSTAQQSTLVVDTLRTSCSMQTAAPRQCAVTRLARRVSARLGLSVGLVWSSTQSAFVAGDLTVPARVRYQETARVITAVAIVELPRSVPLPSGLVTSLSGSRRGDATVWRDTAARMMVRGPSDSIPVIIGRQQAVSLRFALTELLGQRATGSDQTRPVGTASSTHTVSITNGRCQSGKSSPLNVVGSHIESDGTFTCYIRLGESATPNRSVKVLVALDAGSRHVTRSLTVIPIAVPTYAVQGSHECQGIVKRTQRILADRGLPIVTFQIANRRVDLASCERFDRILPIATGALNPMGIYLTGEISETGVDAFTDPRTVGPIELWTTKPLGDPTDDLAEAIVSRLLKYTGL